MFSRFHCDLQRIGAETGRYELCDTLTKANNFHIYKWHIFVLCHLKIFETPLVIFTNAKDLEKVFPNKNIGIYLPNMSTLLIYTHIKRYKHNISCLFFKN